jgi:hypothetical protein
MGDLRVSVAKSFQSALIDQAACPHSFDFLEDRPSARVKLKPWMPGSAPAQVFLHNLVHGAGVAALKLESHCKGDIAALMEDARVIPKLHVIRANGFPAALFRQ